MGAGAVRRRRRLDGLPVANALAREADVVLGIGTRYSDFTTASKTAFQGEGVRFVNLNIAGVDAAKHAGVSLVADAGVGIEALLAADVASYRADEAYVRAYTEHKQRWNSVVDEAYHLDHQPLPAQTEVLGALNELVGPNATVVQAAGSMPGDLQMLWRAQDVKQYHVEYAFSCMGYEIAGALGVKMAAPEREVYALVGDGSYLMMAQEIVTAVSEGIKLEPGDRAEPRLLVDRVAVGEPRVAAVRYVLPLPQFGQHGCSTATSSRSTSPRTPRASGPR